MFNATNKSLTQSINEVKGNLFTCGGRREFHRGWLHTYENAISDRNERKANLFEVKLKKVRSRYPSTGGIIRKKTSLCLEILLRKDF